VRGGCQRCLMNRLQEKRASTAISRGTGRRDDSCGTLLRVLHPGRTSCSRPFPLRNDAQGAVSRRDDAPPAIVPAHAVAAGRLREHVLHDAGTCRRVNAWSLHLDPVSNGCTHIALPRAWIDSSLAGTGRAGVTAVAPISEPEPSPEPVGHERHDDEHDENLEGHCRPPTTGEQTTESLGSGEASQVCRRRRNDCSTNH
jgi:hypothetical protein